MILVLGVDDVATDLLKNEVPILEDLFPSLDVLTVVRDPFSPDVHGRFELL